ncbi:UDP-glycosyltransferase 86A2 [Ziziphus jujuba]|uniref:Glycosyltransferase n=1 Tax=Ziziphus jujuba TaxID=326968 RepID=A0A6P3ZAT8_ZIZJJ|nr:UDP-glycosyltransferase 86A2 [Ziziphus jujuba]
MANNNINIHEKLHAIFIAYPLQGHLIPSVHLAIKLASQGFTITYINTLSVHNQTSKAQSHTAGDKNDDIFASVRKSAGLDIRYTTVSDGLPVDFDRSLNHDTFMAALVHVFSAHVEEVVGDIVGSSSKNTPPVTCLIADTFFVWPSKVAKKFGLLYVSYWTEPALVFTLYYHLHLLRNNGHFACPDVREDSINYIPGIKSIEPKDMTSYLQDSDTSSICHQLIFKAFNDVRGADFVLCNTIQELERDTISALQNDMSFYAIGPIFPIGFAKSSVATSLWSQSDCNHWLNSKPNGSVLYVSFGSYAHLSKQDLVEIANGLSSSNVSFVWVLRPDIVSSDDVDPLPVGFREEVGDRSMIIPWCSQIEVLAHRAIGGFLTHCGWNSILESIRCEVPLLCFPLLTDQFTNRKLVVDDWKVGINLSNETSVNEKEVSDNISRLMGGKLGNDCRKAIKELRMIMDNSLTPNGSSNRNLDQFIKDLKTRTRAA